MDASQLPTLSWSFSKKTHFDSCRRHYFYHRFWTQDPKLKWWIYEMRNLTTLTMLRGQVVHDVIAEALKAIRLGQTVSAKTARDNVTALLRFRYGDSARRLWHIDNRPPGRKQSEITSLLEHYYKFPNMNDRARDAQQSAWGCVTRLVESDFWANIAGSSPSDWVEIEDESFPSFDLDGIKIYTRIDFAHSNGSNTIIDWKTGAQSDQDRRQLMLYSLYAQSKWEWDPLETKLAAVYLQPDLTIDTFSPTLSDLAALHDEVKVSFEQMMELEPAYGPADINLFPMTTETRNCAWCRFMGVCRREA